MAPCWPGNFDADSATDDNKTRHKRCHEALDAVYREGKLDQCVATDLAFHQPMADASHNAIIGHLIASLLRLLQDHLEMNVGELMQHPESGDKLRAQHAAIWQAIEAADPAAAQRAATRHVGYVRETLAETLKREGRRERALRRLEAG